jgi:hypothetical protein
MQNCHPLEHGQDPTVALFALIPPFAREMENTLEHEDSRPTKQSAYCATVGASVILQNPWIAQTSKKRKVDGQ